MRASVVSHGDAWPILEPAEHALGWVALLVELGIVSNWLLAVRPTGDIGDDPRPAKALRKRG